MTQMPFKERGDESDMAYHTMDYNTAIKMNELGLPWLSSG